MRTAPPHTGAGPLLERATENAAVAAYIAAIPRAPGGALLVRGPAGIGKTALLTLACDLARGSGIEVLRARGGELERELPFEVVRQLFAATVGKDDPRARATLLSRGGAVAARVLGVESGPHPVGGPIDEPSSHHALYWLLDALAERQPCLLAIDDLHLADPASLRWIAHLVRRLEGVRAGVAAAVRDGEPPSAPEALAVLEAEAAEPLLAPAPLSERATAALAERVLEREVDASFSRACRQVTGGNPFLVVELARALRQDRLPTGEATAQRLARLTPRTVSRATAIRLGRLGPAARAVAKALAILEPQPALHHVAALADVDLATAADALDALTAAEMTADDGALDFVHPVVRSAVLQEIPRHARGLMHARAAALLRADLYPPEQAAAHLMLSNPAGDPATVETLRAAAGSAQAKGLLELALRYLERALREPPPKDVRATVLQELGSVEVELGSGAGIEHLSEALTMLTRAEDRAAVGEELALAHVLFGDASAGDAVLAGLLNEDLPREQKLRLEAAREAVAQGGSGNGKLPGRYLHHHAELAGVTPAERFCLATLAQTRAMRGDDAATTASLALRALASGKLVDDPRTGLNSVPSTISVLVAADELDAADATLDAAITAAKARGAVISYAWLVALRALARYRRGVLADAEADARNSLEVLSHHGRIDALPTALGYLVLCLVERGAVDQAETELRSAGLVEEIPPARFFQRVLYARARLRLAQNRPAEALEDLLLIGDRQERTRGRALNIPWRVEAALVAARLDRRDLARSLAAAESRWADAWGTRRAHAGALRARAHTDDGGPSIALLEESARVLESSPAALERAQTLHDLGAALRRANRRRDARQALEVALDLAYRCGAERLEREIRQDLLATGARPRRQLRTGAEALTPSERRVAQLAAEGLSNAQVAQALFVTRKTVEKHLGEAYRKLSIGSRTQLADVLEASQGSRGG